MVHRKLMQKTIQRVVKTRPFEAVLEKIKIISASNGNLQAEMKVEEKHTNIFGTLHGGCTAQFVDSVSTYALLTHPRLLSNINTPSRWGVSVDIHVTYLRGVSVGEDILIKVDTIRAEKTLAFLNVTISNKKTGDVVAEGYHTKYIA